MLQRLSLLRPSPPQGSLLPKATHSILAKQTSDGRLVDYCGTESEKTWPSFTGSSVTKLLGDQILLNAATGPEELSCAWQCALLHQGYLAKQGVGDWSLVLGKHWGHVVLMCPVQKLKQNGVGLSCHALTAQRRSL